MATIEQIVLSEEGRKEIVRFCNWWKWHMPDGEMHESCSGDIYNRVKELPQDIRQLFFTNYESIRQRIEDYVEKQQKCLVVCVEPSVSSGYGEAVLRRAAIIAKYKPQSTSDLENKRKKAIFALALRDLLKSYH